MTKGRTDAVGQFTPQYMAPLHGLHCTDRRSGAGCCRAKPCRRIRVFCRLLHRRTAPKKPELMGRCARTETPVSVDTLRASSKDGRSFETLQHTGAAWLIIRTAVGNRRTEKYLARLKNSPPPFGGSHLVRACEVPGCRRCRQEYR
jgi:hypothetical protein